MNGCLRTEQRPQDCWDWLTPEEVARMAVLAFDMARKASFPVDGDAFRDSEGGEWSSRQMFADNVALIFGLQVKGEAYRLGIGGEDFAQDAYMLGRWRASEWPIAATTHQEAGQ